MRPYILLALLGAALSGYVGYYLGSHQTSRTFTKESEWEKLSPDVSGELLLAALKYGNWKTLSQQNARSTLPLHLDAAHVPAGDLVIPSTSIHSGRYVISQWQRVAAGAAIVVLGYDEDEELSIALGPQRGLLVPPQGYMEARLPHDDETGLRNKGASRINGKTGELVMADASIQETAVREIREELGLHVNHSQLHLIDVGSTDKENAVVPTIAAKYSVLLPTTPPLRTIDTEFVGDDMSNPNWIRIRDITCKGEFCYAMGSELPIDPKNIETIQKAIQQLIKLDKDQLKMDLITFKPSQH